MKNGKGVDVLAGFIGALVGIALTKALFLDVIEKLAFEMFFSNRGSFEIGRVLSSSTFWKCVVGAVLGGAAGVFGTRRLMAARTAPPPASGAGQS